MLQENVTGRETVAIGSTEPPAENFMELAFIVQKVVADGAKKVTVILPYFGYSRGDKEAKEGEVATAKAIATMLQSVGGGNLEVVLIDPHSHIISEFFSVPVKEISMIKELANGFANTSALSIVAPDFGALERAGKFAEVLKIEKIVRVEKERVSPEKVEIKRVTGEVKRSALIVDDMVQTGGTILEVAKAMKVRGVDEVFVAATHMVYSAGGWRRLAESNLIDGVVTTNTIEPPKDLPSKFKVIDITPVLKKIINVGG